MKQSSARRNKSLLGQQPRHRLAAIALAIRLDVAERSGLAVVSAEAEGVPGWVEEHSDVLLRLVRSHRRSEGNRLGDR